MLLLDGLAWVVMTSTKMERRNVLAFPNLSEIVTTTLRNRTGELADNMSRNNAALLRLTRRGNLKTFSGGRTIVQELNYAI